MFLSAVHCKVLRASAHGKQCVFFGQLFWPQHWVHVLAPKCRPAILGRLQKCARLILVVDLNRVNLCKVALQPRGLGGWDPKHSPKQIYAGLLVHLS